MTYELQEIDAMKNVEVYYVYEDGRRQLVSSQQDLFVKWLAAGNKPTRILFVPVPVPTLESKIAEAKAQRELRFRDECDPILLKVLTSERENDLATATKLSEDWRAIRQAIKAAIPIPVK